MFRLEHLQSYDSDDEDQGNDLRDSAKSQDSDNLSLDITTLSKAFEEALLVESTANLYALGMRDFIEEINNSYHEGALKIISTGFAMEPWTETKIKLFERPRSIIENVLKTCQSGIEAKSQLTTDIDAFEKETIAAARLEYQSKSNTTPKEGSMEVYYIPAIKKAIDIVYRIYFLFQISDKTREDCRSSELVQAAESFARRWSSKLLHKTDEKSLRQADQILSDIETSCRKMIRNATAARAARGPESEEKPNIERLQLLTVNGAFARKIKQVEKKALERAYANIVTLLKKGVNATNRAAVSAASMLGNAVQYVNEMVGDYWVPSKGPQTDPESSAAPPSSSQIRVKDQMPKDVELLQEYEGSENDKTVRSMSLLQFTPPSTPKSEPQKLVNIERNKI